MKTFTSVLFLKDNSAAVTVNRPPVESYDPLRRGPVEEDFPGNKNNDTARSYKMILQ